MTSNQLNRSADNPQRLASSEDIPRAVEKLLQWIIRLGFYCLAILCAGLATAGMVWNWSRWIAGTLTAVAVGAVVAGRVCGGPCPLVFTAPEKSQPPVPTTDADQTGSSMTRASEQ